MLARRGAASVGGYPYPLPFDSMGTLGYVEHSGAQLIIHRASQTGLHLQEGCIDCSWTDVKVYDCQNTNIGIDGTNTGTRIGTLVSRGTPGGQYRPLNCR